LLHASSKNSRTRALFFSSTGTGVLPPLQVAAARLLQRVDLMNMMPPGGFQHIG
jgi:hypothetical protein